MINKRVLVTGSGTGIGKEVALQFAREAAAVALHYAHSAEGALSAVAEIEAWGGKARAFSADLRTDEGPRDLANASLDFLDGLDVLVNNAGITMNRSFEDVTPDQFDTVYRVNVRAPFFLTQACLPALVASQGAVVNLSSIHAYVGNPGHAVYAGTRGAITAFTRELAIELAARGVRVNAIAPGAIEVESYYKIAPDFNAEAAGVGIPAGYIGQPIDIAHAAVFLASSEARFILGQTLIVDGGTTSWLSFGDGFRHPSQIPFGRGYVPGM